MRKLRNILSSFWPILGLTGIVLIISIVNYVPGTYLTGWDNLHPEFNFLLNIKRSFFSVWEEYQSLGLLGGHAHSSDIFRQVTLFVLSFIFPESFLRYLSTFFMLLAGTLGAYVLIHFILTHASKYSSSEELRDEPRSSSAEQQSGSRLASFVRTVNLYQSIAFLGALFYLLNLATVQTFYAPFEAFIAHFASLPWLLFGSLTYLFQPTKKHRWYLILALLFALPAAYIPTLFLVYGMALGICILVYFCFFPTKQTLLKIVKLGSYIFLINAFWLLPFLYFTATNAAVNPQSRINQMATDTIFLQNKEFGTLPDVALLKGFWFNNTDPNRDLIFSYMMEPWRRHLENPLIVGIGYLFFLIILGGAVISIKRRRPLPTMFFFLLIFSITALAISTPPFSWVNAILRESIPLLNQAFRFPFTKFSVLAGLTYAVLFSVALQSLLNRWSRVEVRGRRSKIENRNLSSSFNSPLLSSILYHLLPFIMLTLLITFSFPVFKGNLLYNKERLAIPHEYQEVFTFFNSQNHASRIANLPQHTFWGWNFYSWGYGGSGFLWYGLPQPILDRAFDVWSRPAENYYYELSQAVYTKNPTTLRAVLDKYQISWLLLDENVVYPPSPKVLFYDELKSLINDVPDITVAKKFGNITIYKVSGVQNNAQFVYTAGKLPTVNNALWLSDDLAYQTLGTYASAPDPETTYPFRSIATVKSAAENTVQVRESATEITLTTTVIPSTLPRILSSPDYASVERILPVQIRSIQKGSQLIIEAVIMPPKVTLGETSVGGGNTTRNLFVIASTVTFPLELQLNGETTIEVTREPRTLVSTVFSLTEPNILTLTPRTGTSKQINIQPEELKALPLLAAQTKQVTGNAADHVEVTMIKSTDPALAATIPAERFKQVQNCDGFRNGSFDTQVINQEATKQLQFSSDNATACTSYYAETLPHDIGYLIQITAENKQGRPLHFWVENVDQRRGPIDTYLPVDKTVRTNTYFLPPLETFGRSYAFHFDNISIGNEQPVNNLKDLTYYPFPYRFTSAIRLISGSQASANPPVLQIPETIHPNESLYEVTLKASDKPETIVLSQAYDAGWRAYVMNDKCLMSNIQCQMLPFIFGSEVNEHFQVNNWANGWVLKNNQCQISNAKCQIVIVYLPQYLQYFGTIVTSFTVFFVLLASLKRWRRA